ncbi:MAG: Ig-like domain-containing protein [Ichthyobacteriaceae bacterium]|nr:Ig-like domain-containing protein [Ichthyobacteriaceae bacterium]
MYFTHNIHKIIIVASALFVASCAKPGRPTGGPKDETPPEIVSSKPLNESVNFTSDKIIIKFDELIKLKDLRKQLVISPPMKHKPNIRPTSSPLSYLKIEIKDTLSDNTTYTFNFGNSIIDNNEGNILPNFRYVFSTGNYIDSLSVEGKIKDAFENDFAENIMVMLYEVDSLYTDSVIYNQPPRYVTSTIKSDTFKIENIKHGKYLMIALEDKASDLKYNPEQDKLAFYPEFITIPDTNKFLLEMFMQEKAFKIKKPFHSAPGNVFFEFEGKPTDLTVNRINYLPSDTLIERFNYSKYKDTVNYWFSANEVDSMQFIIASYKNKIEDTVTVKMRKHKQEDASFKPSKYGKINPNQKISVISSAPIIKYITDSISVMNMADSSNVEFKTSVKNLNELVLNFDKNFNSKYYVTLLPGAIKNIFDNKNDTLIFNANVPKKSDYGEISITIQNIKSYPVIVNLLTTKGSIVKTLNSAQDDTFIFKHLKPGKYVIQLIYDANSNEYWDAGNFLERKFPEEVKYFLDTLDLKANWEIQQDWILSRDSL